MILEPMLYLPHWKDENNNLNLLKKLMKLKSAKELGITRRHIVLASLMTLVLLLSSVSLLRLSPYNQRDNSGQYFRAKVISVKAQDSPDLGPQNDVQAQLMDGPRKGQILSVRATSSFGDAAAKRIPVGSEVLLYRAKEQGNQYALMARWHMPGVATLFILLLFLVLAIGAWRGITSLFGLAISVFILASFVIPSIVNGHDALTACIEGAVLITLVSVFIAHGFNNAPPLLSPARYLHSWPLLGSRHSHRI